MSLNTSHLASHAVSFSVNSVFPSDKVIAVSYQYADSVDASLLLLVLICSAGRVLSVAAIEVGPDAIDCMNDDVCDSIRHSRLRITANPVEMSNIKCPVR